jgi:hypothetical protein
MTVFLSKREALAAGYPEFSVPGLDHGRLDAAGVG